MKPLSAGLVLGLLLPLLAACSSGPFGPAPEAPELCLVTAPAEAFDPPRSEVVLLADHYGLELDAPPATGTSASAAELRDLLEMEGFKVFVFSGNLGATATGVVGNLDKGRPLLALIEIARGPIWVLLVGRDGPTDSLIVQRPDGRLAALATTEFERLWRLRERLLILALPESLTM